MGRLYRAVRLKNNGKSRNIVAFIDSGSDTTIISKRIAHTLGIKITEGGGIIMPDGRNIPSEVGEIIVEIEHDNIKKKWVVDITDIPFNEDIDDVDMIIGVDLLQECDVKIHFQGQTTRVAKKGPVWRAPATSHK
jgi:predicted aspartyl protease